MYFRTDTNLMYRLDRVNIKIQHLKKTKITNNNTAT